MNLHGVLRSGGSPAARFCSSALWSPSESGRRRVWMADRSASGGDAFAGRREAVQNQFDDALGERLVDWSAGNQQPIEDRPAQYVERELEIQSATEIPALYTALQDRAEG